MWFIANGVNTALFSALLASFAAEVGAGPDKHIILVLDGAGWHVARDLVVPEGFELMFLPPYSPQIQPAERLWPLTNEPIVNEYFETLEELDEVLAERCRILADDPDQIKAHTLFEWWPHHNQKPLQICPKYSTPIYSRGKRIKEDLHDAAAIGVGATGRLEAAVPQQCIAAIQYSMSSN